MAGDRGNLVETLENAWRDALCAKDMERLEEMLHPDFTLIGTRASGPFVMNRQEWLAAIQRRKVLTIDLEVTDRFVGPGVVVGTIRSRWQIEYLDQKIEDCVILTDVWVDVDGKWMVVRRHSTPASCDAFR